MSGSLSGATDAVIAAAVVVLIVAKQFRARQISEGFRWLLLPAILVVLGVQHGDVVDPRHQGASAALLAAGIVIGAGMGVAWAFTARIWRDESGVAWTRGTAATAAVWIGGLLLRIGLLVLGGMMGMHEGQGAFMLTLAATLLVRKGVLALRVGAGVPALRASTAR